MTVRLKTSLRNSIILWIFFLIVHPDCKGQKNILDNVLHHLRNGPVREWSEFPARAETSELLILFTAAAGTGEQTLALRQYDVRSNWRLWINDSIIGSLVIDEKDIISYFRVNGGMLRAGQNTLRIFSDDPVSDDIRVGEVSLYPRPLESVLPESFLDLELADDRGRLMPAHFTVVNAAGALQPVTGSNEKYLAIRTGNVYSSTGKGSIGLPAGTYTVYAGRGFEYGIDSATINLRPGDRKTRKFKIKREVDTKGWIASDTHIHTFTHSGHGDATDRERVITLAAEGIELPVITDHNVHIDLRPEAVAGGVDRYFTLVTGNEVTTKVGHFNVFPVFAAEPVIDHDADNWLRLSQNMQSHEGRVIILNHGRDIHGGFRPFDPTRFAPSSGQRIDNEHFFVNAMEILNSGSQQTDILQLTHDWFAVLNRGNFISPVGSSDSHDVTRFIVGQGRTYIQCDDSDPGNVNVDLAVRNFLAGNVMVSGGLLAKILVNNRYGPGSTVPDHGQVEVSVGVMGPAWSKADRVSLYANGEKIREAGITDPGLPGLKWDSVWRVDVPSHDVFFVAVAEGPGGNMPYWPVAKPYQPVSEEWHPRVIGISGAVWVDGDGNGHRNSAKDYAHELIRLAGSDFSRLIKILEGYDEAVSAQVAGLLWERGVDPGGKEIIDALLNATSAARAGFDAARNELPALQSAH